MLGEELLIQELKRNSDKLSYKKIVGPRTGKKEKAALERLIKKEIVELKKGTVYLIDKERITAFEARYEK